MTSPTNWIIGDGDMVRRGDRVRIDDGREGVIDAVSVRGRPMVALDDGQRREMHPAYIAACVRKIPR